MDVISDFSRQKITIILADKKYGPQKCPVYMKMPWLGKFSLRSEDQTRTTITKSFGGANPRLVFSTRKVLPSTCKDCIPITQKVWLFTNFQAVRCQVRRSHFLEIKRQDEKVCSYFILTFTNTIFDKGGKPLRNARQLPTLKHDIAIGQHLLDHLECAEHYCLQIIGRARSLFHLSVCESAHIKPKGRFCVDRKCLFSHLDSSINFLLVISLISPLVFK